MPFKVDDHVSIAVADGCKRASIASAIPKSHEQWLSVGVVVSTDETFFTEHPYHVEAITLQKNEYGYHPKGDFAESELTLLEYRLVENQEIALRWPD